MALQRCVKRRAGERVINGCKTLLNPIAPAVEDSVLLLLKRD